MMRLLSVPADFFRKYTAGDLAARAGYVSTMSDAIIDAVFTSGLASLFSLLYLAQIVNYAPALAVPSVIILLLTAALTILATLAKMRYNRRLMTLGAEHKGLEYALIAGVQKIKLSGSEKRVFAKWANSYAEYMELNCSNGLPWLVNRADIVALAVTLIGTVVMYFLAVRSGVSVAEYTAFNTAYGEVSVAFTALAGVVGSVASIKPTLELARPILAARPETAIPLYEQFCRSLSAALGKPVATGQFGADMKVEYSERKVNGFNNVNPMDYALTTARTLYPDERYIRSTNYVSEEIEEGEFAGNYAFNYDLTYNVFTELDETSNVGKTDELGATLMLRGNVTSYLKFDALASYTKTVAFTERTATDRSYYMASLRGYDYGAVDPGSVNEKLSPYPYGGKLDRDEENSQSWMANLRLNFSKYWDDIHSLNIMAGGEMSSRKQTGFQTSEFGYFPDRGKTIYYEYNQSDAGNLSENYGDSYTKHSVKLVDRVDNKMSVFATLAYGYKNRYVLNANFRVDASSRFGENTNNRFLPIWSVAGRWNMTEEDWMKGQDVLNELAFKLSYGSQGNVVNTVGPELIASYPNKPVDETVGEYFLNLKSLPYPDLRWEKTHTVNVGVEFALWNGRINGSFEYYKKTGKELLYTLEVPMELGIDAAYQNGADIVNEGLDVYLSLTPVKVKDWSWTLSPVFSLNRDKIHRKTENRTYSDYIDGTVVLNDYPVGGFWSWRYKGLTHEEGLPVFDYDGGAGYTNAEMKEDPSKFLVYSGRTNPIMTGGLTTRLTWKQFMLRASFAYNLGAKVRIRPVYSSSLALNVPEYYENVTSAFVTHWRKPGDEKFTDNPGFLRPGKSAMYDHPGGSESFYTMWDDSDFRVVSGDFLRCRSIGLSYNLPQEWLSRWGVKGMMIELSGNDLFLIKSKKLDKQDPETSSSEIPRLPSYSFTLNISL